MVDLVVCHGDFLNIDHDYRHKNKSIKTFGSYGDILIRDRKMYVVPTPFRLIEGVAHQQTLVLPAEMQPGRDFLDIGTLKRIEAAQMVVGYTFNLQTNCLTPRNVPNPDAGREHVFRAWRLRGSSKTSVAMRDVNPVSLESDGDRENDNE